MELFGYYIQSLFETTVPFLLAWELYVFLTTAFFCSIVWRLARLERKLNRLLRGKSHG
jgi:hypothetical protein